MGVNELATWNTDTSQASTQSLADFSKTNLTNPLQTWSSTTQAPNNGYTGIYGDWNGGINNAGQTNGLGSGFDMGGMNGFMGGFSQFTQGLGSLASIYTGFQTLGLMKDQVGMAKEQWGITKDKLARVSKTRADMGDKYMGREPGTTKPSYTNVG